MVSRTFGRQAAALRHSVSHVANVGGVGNAPAALNTINLIFRKIAWLSTSQSQVKQMRIGIELPVTRHLVLLINGKNLILN